MADDECNCAVPEDAQIVSVLHAIKYMSADGEIWRVDLSHDSVGDELAYGEIVEMADWVRMVNQLPLMADMLHSIMFGEEGEM